MKKFAFAFLLSLLPFHAFAASLYFSPPTAEVSIGENFTVAVDISSADQAMNAASGDISFPSDKLRVLSVSNAGSAMNLWVQNPSFSNAAGGGDVNFAGVVLNPGFIGTAGTAITIRFQAIAAGSAALSFSDGSILANDGNGTNILTSLGTASVVVTSAPDAVAAPRAATTTAPAPFAILSVSGTDNDPTNPQPLFTWSTTDPSSGIEKYMVKIGSGDWFNAATIAVAGTPNEYQLPLQAPEQNVVLAVDVYDNAGDVTTATTTFSIAGLAPPSITSYTDSIVAGQTKFTVTGSIPKDLVSQITTVRIYLQNASDVVAYAAPVDSNGNFDFNQPVNLPTGTWILHAQAADGRGALTSNTPQFAITVGGWVANIIAFLLSWGAILAVAIIVLGAIIAIAYLTIHHGRRFHLSLSREIVRERKELRDDLKRIERELDGERESARIDLSPGGMRKKQEHVRQEIEHLEQDLRKDIKEL